MSDTSMEPNSQDGIMTGRRRKRVNQLKALIIILTVLLLLLPTVFCIILGIQVSRLQKQMKEIVDLHSEYGLTYDTGKENLAYAAEKPLSDVPSETITSSGGSTNSEIISSEDTIADNVSIVSGNTTDARDSTGAVSDNTSETESGNTTDTATDGTGVNPTGDTTAVDDGDTVAAENSITAGTDIAAVTPEAGSSINPADSNSTLNADITDIYKGKSVYLTFDDGPSIYTGEILDILAEYNVKATFFVIGKTDKASKKLYQRIVDEGHTLGMHSYSHKYDIIYNSVEDFDKDFTKLWKLLYDTTGYKPFLYRFPGGSNNRVNKYGMEEFIRYLNKSSITYFDWNVVNGDATGVQYTKEQLIDNALNGVAEKKNPIVLMHDARSKETTVESLPGLLDKLILGGAQILPLDKDVKPIQMIKADSIK